MAQISTIVLVNSCPPQTAFFNFISNIKFYIHSFFLFHSTTEFLFCVLVIDLCDQTPPLPPTSSRQTNKQRDRCKRIPKWENPKKRSVGNVKIVWLSIFLWAQTIRRQWGMSHSRGQQTDQCRTWNKIRKGKNKPFLLKFVTFL